MSCLANIDPYNNFPDSKRGGPPPLQGGNASTFAKPYDGNRAMAQRPRGSELPPRIPNMTGPIGGIPAPMVGGPIDLETQNAMLMSDLQTAIGYIRHLGGTWPPPGG